jgi:hypothetical protein
MAWTAHAPRTREVAWVRRGKTDALDAGHVVHVAQQVCERVLPPAAAVVSHAWQVPPVRVHVLAQQRDLLVACACLRLMVRQRCADSAWRALWP